MAQFLARLGIGSKASVPQREIALTGEVIPPHTGPKCPFYGFVGCGTHYMGEPLGNGCALKGGHSPCQMEVVLGEAAAWDKCPVFNHVQNTEDLRQVMEHVTVTPKVFWPEGAGSWEGMKFGEWFKYVMGREFP